MASISAALALAEQGVPVLPVRTDKRPLTRHGVHQASTDQNTIREWFARFPGLQIAAAAGGPAHMLVIDCDRHGGPDGVAAYAALGIPDVGEPLVRTGRGGRHHWFRAGRAVGSGAGILAPGIDHRGEGAYVLTPDSVSDYGAYEWERRLQRTGLPLAPAPLMDRLTAPAAAAGSTWEPSPGALIRRLQGAVVGERNYTLNLCAFLMGRLVAAGRQDERTALASLTETGLALGLPAREVRATVKSGLFDGIAARGLVPLAEHRRQALQALEWAGGQTWSGRAGPTMRGVFVGHALCALQAGRAEYGADVRTLAELANVARSTAQRSTIRLLAAGFLERVDPGRQPLPEGAVTAARYRLCLNGTITQCNPEIGKMGDVGVEGEWANDDDTAVMASERAAGLPHTHELFSRHGLGREAGLVFAALQALPGNIDSLVTRTGRSRRSVYRAIEHLTHIMDQAGGQLPPLVRSGPAGWIAELADLDEVARRLGVAGLRERQHAQHEREREAYAAGRLSYARTHHLRKVEKS